MKEWWSGRTSWIAALVVCTAVVAVTFALGVPALRSGASGAKDRRVEVSFSQAPRWMLPNDLAPIQERVALEAGTDPYDRAGLERAKVMLERSGWFDSVTQVRRVALGGIEVTGEFAEPTALVADAQGDNLIDSRGRLMPRSYAHGTSPAITRITGASLPRPVRAGEYWQGADVAAGLEMAKLVALQRWRAQIASVDVSQYRDHQTLALTTVGGCRLNWGRAPGAEAAAEVPASQKLRYLSLLQSQFGRLDGAGQQAIDLSVDYVGSR